LLFFVFICFINNKSNKSLRSEILFAILVSIMRTALMKNPA